MTGWNAPALERLTRGKWINRPPLGWKAAGLCAAAKNFRDGQMILLRGPKGRFGVPVEEARTLLKASSGIITEVGVKAGETLPILRVENLGAALHLLGLHARKTFDGLVFGVTGSAGKTSTCGLLRASLASAGQVAKKNTSNFQIVSFLQFLASNRDADFLVAEMAMAYLQRNSAHVQPNVAMLTTIAEAHLEKRASLEDLALSKAWIFRNMEKGGVALIGRDTPFFEMLAAIAAERASVVIGYGRDPSSAARLLSYDIATKRVEADILGRRVGYKLAVLGEHMAVNSIGVLAALASTGIDIEPAMRALERVRPAPGRGTRYRLRLGERSLVLIDDAYNANPASMRAGLAMLGGLKPASSGRRIAVLGDMLELGPDSDAFHEALAAPLREMEVAAVFLAGAHMARLRDALPEELVGSYAADARALVPVIADYLRNDDIVYFKGSNASNIHAVVKGLKDAADDVRVMP